MSKYFKIAFYLVFAALVTACSEDEGFSGAVSEEAAGAYYGDASFQSGGRATAFGVTVEVVRVDGNTLSIVPAQGNTFTSAFEVEVGELDQQVISRETENSNFDFFSIDMRTTPFQFSYQLTGSEELFIGLHKESMPDLTQGLIGIYNGTLVSEEIGNKIDVKVNVSKVSNTKLLINMPDIPSIETFEMEVQVSAGADSVVFGSSAYLSGNELFSFNRTASSTTLTMERSTPEFLFSGSLQQ